MIAIFLVAILGCSFADQSFNWSKIQSKNVYMEPINKIAPPVLPRVIGGQEAEPNSRPYQVAIVIDSSYFCGGSLISSNFVLTAAHCLEGYAYFQVILGAHNIQEAEPTQIVITSTNLIVHPDYNPANLNNDIGLIRFPNRIVFNEHIHSIALPVASAGSFVDFKAVLSGWGRRSDDSSQIAPTLHEVNVTIISNNWCSNSYGIDVVILSTLCTSGYNVVGACDGDSGGPLVVEEVLVGVASFAATSGCEQGLPTGYARITSFIDWIEANAELD